MADELLNIVNEQGEVIGEAPRSRIHKEGLLHREINVWFYTPKGEVIFQKRGPNKDTYPSLLDSAVGGHVDLGESFESAVVRELTEEVGLKVTLGDLYLFKSYTSNSFDKITSMRNHAMKKIYLYRYRGDPSGLKVEAGSSGFIWIPVTDLLSPPYGDDRFIPKMIENAQPLLREILKLTS